MSARPDPDAERVNPARVGEAAGEAAAQGGASRAETRHEAGEAAQAASGGKLSEREKDEIADRTIERLERRGAFEQVAPPGSGETPPQAEQPPAEREAAEASGEGPPPRKRTPAERFVGRK